MKTVWGYGLHSQSASRIYMNVCLNNTRLLGAITILILLIAVCPVNGDPADILIHGSVPMYTDAPVFYDFFWRYYADMENLELVHEGKVMLGRLGIEPIENFDWIERPGKSNSYWVRMENFWYLTPLIHSTAERDQAFVREWFEGWIDAHDNDRWDNYGAKDAMSAGFRVMTFVWYLHRLHERGEADSVWIEQIRYAVKEHQEYLKGKFFPVSNHGYWESMGLFETTRIFPDTAIVRLALERLNQMIAASITGKGFHVERSPFYQIEVLNWITRYVEYFRALEGFEWSGFAKLEAAQRKMSAAVYYMFDHGGNVPQVGDTGAKRYNKRRPRSSRRSNMPEAIVDKRAGYAIYKDAEARCGRYVVFTIPNVEHPNKMPYHNHNDLLSVYYSHRGEIIFGDQGVFSYRNDENLRYFKSAVAHNTVMPVSQFVKSRGSEVGRKATEVLVHEDDGIHLFTASFNKDKVTRVVRIPKNDVTVEVVDVILDEQPYVILWHMGCDVESIHRIETADTNRVNSDGLVEYGFELTTLRRRNFLLTILTNSGPPESEEFVEVVSGLESPMLGWYSPGYNQKVPISVVVIRIDVHEFANITTVIKPLGY